MAFDQVVFPPYKNDRALFRFGPHVSQHVLVKVQREESQTRPVVHYMPSCHFVLQSFKVSNFYSGIAAMFFSNASNGVLFISFYNCVGFSEERIKPVSLFV